MDMLKEMSGSEALEIGLRSGHVLYGKFREMVDDKIVMSDTDGAILFIPTNNDNIAYVKLVPPDAELSATINRLNADRRVSLPIGQENSQGRVDVPPTVLDGLPHDRSTAKQAVEQARARLESVKEKYRHANNSFKESAKGLRPAYRPTIQIDDPNEVQYRPTVLSDEEDE